MLNLQRAPRVCLSALVLSAALVSGSAAASASAAPLAVSSSVHTDGLDSILAPRAPHITDVWSGRTWIGIAWRNQAGQSHVRYAITCNQYSKWFTAHSYGNQVIVRGLKPNTHSRCTVRGVSSNTELAIYRTKP